MRGSASPFPGARHPNTKRGHRRQDAGIAERQICPFDGHPLRHATGHDGTPLDWCPACTRRRAGLCQDCGKPRASRAIRCPACRRTALLADQERFRQRHRARLNAKARAYQRRRRGVPGPGIPRHSPPEGTGA